MRGTALEHYNKSLELNYDSETLSCIGNSLRSIGKFSEAMKFYTAALNENPDLIILDDGLQDSSINKSKSIVAINGRRGFGNKLLLPSGPLRENISSTLKKNYIFLILGEDKTNISSKYNNFFFKAEIISEVDDENR